jgi:acetyl-CoA C-acetyltransferase
MNDAGDRPPAPDDVVVVSAARTPHGALQGALASVPAAELGATAARGALRRAGLDVPEAAPEGGAGDALADVVDLALFGNVLQAGQGQAPARQATLAAGLPHATPTATINKMCGSGLEAIVQGARALKLGEVRTVLAGGMESMSRAPYLLPGARDGYRLGHREVVDSVVHDGLWDVYADAHMGACAEACARTYAFDRATQDAFALRSYERAQAATASGVAAWEIEPVVVPGRKGATVVDADEGPRKVDPERVPTLRPAFEADGTITAANASSIDDGAAALLLATRAEADRRGWPVLARLEGWATHAQDPTWFTTAPIAAMRTLFERTGWTPASVERYEINEAFAVVPLAAMEAFDLPAEKVDVLGGAIALGHPIGASGARIVVTLLNALRVADARRGVASICIGGGEAWALALTREGA